jgi:hypothetical protein
VSSFKTVARRMIQDVQERITYLAQTYIRDEIINFSPVSEDLDYPNKLNGEFFYIRFDIFSSCSGYFGASPS